MPDYQIIEYATKAFEAFTRGDFKSLFKYDPTFYALVSSRRSRTSKSRAISRSPTFSTSRSTTIADYSSRTKPSKTSVSSHESNFA